MTTELGFSFISTAIGIFAGLLCGWLAARFILKSSARVSPAEHESAMMELSAIRARLDEKISSANAMEKELSSFRAENTEIKSELAARTAVCDGLESRLASQKQELTDIKSSMSEEFSKIANQVMVTRSADFNKQTEDKLRMLLSPLKENIDRFEKKIDETRTLQLRESTSLKEQITQLSGLNQQMSQEAKNLTLALKGESKTRGTWGEMILESILDKSGLIKNDHYTVQQTLKDQEGRTLRPDVIVNLPENKHLVIDSKIALVDYENYVNSSGEAEAARFIKAHIAALRRHVGELSNKNYQTLYGITPPDFVLMFVPIEPAFNAALENDQDIWNYALSRNVLMLTPSTLVATLKIIYSIWRQESQNRNAVAIAETGGKLYDKFVGFIEDLSEIGRGIEKTQKCYDEAMKKLSTGRGNLVGMTEKMRELGAKATKSLPVSSDDAGE